MVVDAGVPDRCRGRRNRVWKHGCWSAGACGSPPNQEWGTTVSAEIPRSVRNSVCGVSKSRPTHSDHDKEIAKLKRELRAIDVAIADFERLEANTSSKGKGIKTPKSQI